MKREFDVVALGELLVDFTSHGTSEQGNPLLEACPGGAPCNVLAMLSKLGKKTAFLGKVGADAFGDQLADAASKAGIDLSGLRRDREVHTTLAVVHTLPGGDRQFSFYRKPGADINLRPEELELELIDNCRVFHFGTLSLTDEPCATATKTAVARARAAGALISFDPNLREPLWDDLADAKAAIEWGLAQADVLKISDNEVEFLFPETVGAGVLDGPPCYDEAVKKLRERYPNLKLICVTAGAHGSYAYCGNNRVFRPGVKLGGVIETTGAGDTFCASMLNYLLEAAGDTENCQLSDAQLGDMLTFANAAAYLVTTRKGALRAMPERAEVDAVLRRE